MIDKNFHRSDFLKFGLAFGAGALSACSSGVQPAIPSMKARETGYGAMVRSTANAVSMIAPASGKILIAVKISAEESGDIVASAASDFGDIPLSFSVNRSRSGSVNLGSGVTLTFSGGAAAFSGERVSGKADACGFGCSV